MKMSPPIFSLRFFSIRYVNDVDGIVVVDVVMMNIFRLFFESFLYTFLGNANRGFHTMPPQMMIIARIFNEKGFHCERELNYLF